MKKVNTMKNMRELVRKGYNEGSYEEKYSRKNMNMDELEKFLCNEIIKRTEKEAKILDLGCGTGLPYNKYFVKKGFKLTGVDISERHISLAKKNVKTAKYIVGDFFTDKIKGKYDAITSFYAIFHIPREEHFKLFKRIHGLLKKGGHILITLATDSMKKDINPDFAGAPMAWSSYGIDKNKKLIKDAGFEIIVMAEDYRTERHMWILARKK